MFGEAVTTCHIRVPVSSNPKYCSVSRFSRTDSRSRKRIRTWAGVAARSVNETISAAPSGEPPAFSFTARGRIAPCKAFYRGLLPFATYLRTGEVAFLQRACKRVSIVFERKTGYKVP